MRFTLYLGIKRKEGKTIYYRNNAGGWNKTHGQIEQVDRIDSFEAAAVENWGTLFAYKGDGSVPLDCERYTGYGPGDAEQEIIELSYCGSQWSDALQLTRIKNGFGGTRAFWLCPCCGKRVRYLYFKDRHFVCRECARLNYRSQQETKGDMLDYYKGMDYAEKHFGLCRFGRPDGFSFPYYEPDKPKGMHWSTYRRRLIRFRRYQLRYAEQLTADLARLAKGFR